MFWGFYQTRDDVYSFILTLIKLITGKLPCTHVLLNRPYAMQNVNWLKQLPINLISPTEFGKLLKNVMACKFLWKTKLWFNYINDSDFIDKK